MTAPASTPLSTSHTPDLSGRDRILRNVLSSWGGHLFFVASGFLMPRILDQHVGQSGLGVWDFAWSLVGYFDLAQIGIGSSVNRYVAKYRATGDVEGLRRTISTVTTVQAAAALLIAIVTCALVWTMPATFGSRLGDELDAARWVVGLLGAALAFQMAFDGFRGVLAGCHRWDLHNGLTAGFHALTVLGMLAVLLAGKGLRSVALVSAVGMMTSEVVRAIVAYRVCPEMRIRLSYASWAHARELIAFGGKTLADSLSRLLLFQANNLVVASTLGPAALAVYARPAALVRHGEALINKFAFVLTPAASSLQSSGQDRDLRELLLQSSRFAAYLTVPMVLTLVVMGDLILLLWMGPQYEPGPVLALLAIGYFLPLTQRPAMQVLMGLNLHGWVAMTSLAMSSVGLALSYVLVNRLNLGLTGAAIAVAIPLTLSRGVFTAVHACRHLQISLGEYARRTSLGPAACGVPFTLALILGRSLGRGPVADLLIGLAFGGAVLIPLYWRFGIPSSLRATIVRRLPRRLRPMMGGDRAAQSPA
jgi:O-antigen/teichoic acid export membrane protein